MRTISRLLDRLFQFVTIGLLLLLAVIVVIAVIFRYTGSSLIWYDEISSILLAWLTFIGAGFAALRNAHMGFYAGLLALPTPIRASLFVIVEIIFVATFLVVAWAGWAILAIFGDDSLVSLPWLSLAVTQSILPISAVLIVIARLLTLPERWQQTLSGTDPETLEIDEEIARAERELQSREGATS